MKEISTIDRYIGCLLHFMRGVLHVQPGFPVHPTHPLPPPLPKTSYPQICSWGSEDPSQQHGMRCREKCETGKPALQLNAKKKLGSNSICTCLLLFFCYFLRLFHIIWQFKLGIRAQLYSLELFLASFSRSLKTALGCVLSIHLTESM